jgi:hypothetical protein
MRALRLDYSASSFQTLKQSQCKCGNRVRHYGSRSSGVGYFWEPLAVVLIRGADSVS